jgi:hypothetical protein
MWIATVRKLANDEMYDIAEDAKPLMLQHPLLAETMQ